MVGPTISATPPTGTLRPAWIRPKSESDEPEYRPRMMAQPAFSSVPVVKAEPVWRVRGMSRLWWRSSSGSYEAGMRGNGCASRPMNWPFQ